MSGNKLNQCVHRISRAALVIEKEEGSLQTDNKWKWEGT